MKPYEFIEHTGDMGVLVHGADLKELFINAAFALFDITWDLSSVEERLKVPIKLKEAGTTELLISFLRELLYLSQGEDYIFKRFEIKEIDEDRLEATAYGEEWDPSRHRAIRELKAVTYHLAEVKRQEGRYQARIIFDI